MDRSDSLVSWLHTHRWHVKRFKMCKMWGFALAKYHSGRGQEFVWSKMKSNCVVHDSSYWRRLQIFGKRNEIENLISPFLVRMHVNVIITL